LDKDQDGFQDGLARAHTPAQLRLDLSGFVRDGAVFIDLLNNDQEYVVTDGGITLGIPRWWGAILVARHGPQDLLPPAPATLAAPRLLHRLDATSFVVLQWELPDREGVDHLQVFRQSGDRPWELSGEAFDETFGCAGTLARAAAEGLRVELLCATRGEAG
jgi:hypothetical protein